MSTMAVLCSLPAGFGLGVFFYGGLWFTVRRLPLTEHPVLLTLGSFWLRLPATLGGFCLVMRLGWQYAAIALASFALGRVVVARFLPERRPAPRCT